MSCTILKNIPYECVTEIKICRLKKRLNKTQQFTSSFVFKEKQNNQERKKKNKFRMTILSRFKSRLALKCKIDLEKSFYTLF